MRIAALVIAVVDSSETLPKGGSPPVLSAENIDSFNEIMRFARSLRKHFLDIVSTPQGLGWLDPLHALGRI